MRRKTLLLFSLVLLCLPTYSRAQIIDPSRTIIWDPGITGGIQNRTTICTTFNPGAPATQINKAIAACSNGVVYHNAGMYALSGGSNFVGTSNVTVRARG